MMAGETDTFDFVANKEGRFLWWWGVAAHGGTGMRDYLVVSGDQLICDVGPPRAGGNSERQRQDAPRELSDAFIPSASARGSLSSRRSP
jgi:hypothetical protein